MENYKNVMRYHQTDERWPAFGCTDFDKYLEHYLVKGTFHKAVPEDVVKSYETVEYLIAHAWYHYPMYDEAFNKLLRTFEMAIKQKCTQMSIPLTTANEKGKLLDKKLFKLIKEICDRERGKKQGVFLDHLRDLRNRQMHSDRHSYVGGMSFGKIQLCINILNLLFAPENFMMKLEVLGARRQEEYQQFNNKAMGFSRDGKTELIHGLILGDTFANEEKEINLLLLEPVYHFTEEHRMKKLLPAPKVVELVNAQISNNSISGTDNSTGSVINIELIFDQAHMSAANNFRQYTQGLTNGHSSTYMTSLMYELSKEIQRFRYKHYQFIT